jgi:DNA-binding transcriptional ArsR family regulator
MEDKYSEIFEAFRNPTKMKIITLLVNNRKMTVTQMSKYIGTTRSNLYQVISGMVSSGIVMEPEIKPKKNYVEKYYRLNEDYFAFHDSNIGEKAKELPADQYRELIASFLMAQSLNMNIMASSIENMPDSKLKELMSSAKKMLMSYGTCSDPTFLRISTALEKELKETSPDNGTDNLFLFFMFPVNLLNKNK